MWKLNKLLIWTIPWVALPTHFNGFWFPKAALLMVGGLSVIALSWVRFNHRKISYGWITGLALWIITLFGIHTLIPIMNIGGTIDRVVRVPLNYFEIFNTLIALICIIWAVTLARFSEDVKRFTDIAETICLAASSVAFYALVQKAGLDPLRLYDRAQVGFITNNPMMAMFGQPMLVANFLAIAAPLALMFRPWRFKVMYLVMAISIALTGSALSLIALLLGTLLCFFLQRRWIMSTLLIIGIALFLNAHSDRVAEFFSLSGRLFVWEHAISLWQRNPLAPWFGFGLGKVETLAASQYWMRTFQMTSEWTYLHNEPIEILFSMGMIGFGLSAGLVLHLTKRLLRYRHNPALIGWIGAGAAFLVVSFGSFPLRFAPTALLAVMIWAALETHSQGGKYASIAA